MTSLILLATLSGIGLRGTTSCPTIQQVDAQLGVVLSPNDGELSWVELEEKPGALQLSLFRPGGRLEARRALPLTSSCEALARASAVTIATWANEPEREVGPVEPEPPFMKSEPARVFEPQALEAMRLDIVQTPLPAPPPRMRGPLLLMAAGTLLQIASVVSGFALQGQPWISSGATAALVGGAFTLGNNASIAGIIWLMGCFSDGTPRF